MKIEVPDEHAIVLLCISAGMREARRKHPGQYVDAHHALGVLEEEVHEFKVEVFKRRPKASRIEREACDIATVAALTMVEVADKTTKARRHEA